MRYLFLLIGSLIALLVSAIIGVLGFRAGIYYACMELVRDITGDLPPAEPSREGSRILFRQCVAPNVHSQHFYSRNDEEFVCTGRDKRRVKYTR